MTVDIFWVYGEPKPTTTTATVYWVYGAPCAYFEEVAVAAGTAKRKLLGVGR